MKEIKYSSLFCFLIILLIPYPASSQYTSISLDEAIALARKNNMGLKRDQLVAKQQEMLADAGILHKATNVYYSSEEIDFQRSGIHSINLEHNFYLPKAVEAQRNYYRSGASLAAKNVKLTERALKWEVSKAYYELMFFKQEEELLHEIVHFYEDFLEKTNAIIEAGESGKIPKLAASSKLGQSRLELEHNEEQHQVSLILFNSWLQSDTIFNVSGKLTKTSFESLSDTIFAHNAHLQINQAKIDLANAEVTRKESLLMPQIISGLKLQMVDSSFPFFGFQLGVNIPLFKKAYRQHIQAAKVGVEVEQTAMQSTKLQLERTIRELQYRLEHQSHILFYLENELKPIVQERHDINTTAFAAGEIGYLDSLDGLADLYKVQLQYLHALLNYNLLKVELEYWTTK